MSKVTSKLQVTVPKAVAERYGIRPGDAIDWVPAGDVIRVIPPRRNTAGLDVKARLELFDEATRRLERRQRKVRRKRRATRGWTRDELYRRGGPR